jgi:hypothetical protein
MRLSIAVMSSFIAIAALAVAGCASGGSAGQEVPSSAAHRSPVPLSARVELSSRTIAAGSSMRARVIVDNRTGRAIHSLGCDSLFAVALVSSSYHPVPGWFNCAQRITIPVGESSYPVTLSASYDMCGSTLPGSAKTCLPGGHMPPLAVGDYRAELFQSTHVVPVPPVISVQVAP